MILDYRGKPLPSAHMGFVPSKPVAPRGENKNPATADAIGYTCTPRTHEEEETAPRSQ